jgi:hypothetical protein
MELRTAPDGFALTFTLCRACYESDPTAARRQATVEARAQALRHAAEG